MVTERPPLPVSRRRRRLRDGSRPLQSPGDELTVTRTPAAGDQRGADRQIENACDLDRLPAKAHRDAITLAQNGLRGAQFEESPGFLGDSPAAGGERDRDAGGGPGAGQGHELRLVHSRADGPAVGAQFSERRRDHNLLALSGWRGKRRALPARERAGACALR